MRRVAGAGLAGLLALAGCSSGAQQPASNAAAGVPVLVRRPAHVRRASSVALSGDVNASKTVSVGFTVPGVVASVGANEGDAVRAGQVLATLDTTEYAIGVDMAVAQRERAEDEYRRAKMVFDSRGVPADDFDKAATAVRLAKAQEALARKKLQDTRLTAPISGVLARRGIEVGEQTGPGYPTFTIMRIEPAEVRVGVPESEIARIAVGAPATIIVPSLRNASFHGTVRMVGIAADPAARTYPVKIEVPNERHILRPGTIAEVHIGGTDMVDALTIPPEAVVRDADGVLRVFVYDAKSARVYGRRVDIGTAYGQEVEARQGLAADELVVIGGQNRVREGVTVVAKVVPLPGTVAQNDR